jgi:hypothetical protein
MGSINEATFCRCRRGKGVPPMPGSTAKMAAAGKRVHPRRAPRPIAVEGSTPPAAFRQGTPRNNAARGDLRAKCDPMAFESLRNCTFRANNAEILQKSDIYVCDNVSLSCIFIHIVGPSSFFNISWPGLHSTQPKSRFSPPPGGQERAPRTLSVNLRIATASDARERSAASHPKTPRPCRPEHVGDLRLEASVKISQLPADA